MLLFCSSCPPLPPPRSHHAVQVYNWTLVDDLYDAIIAAGVKPIVELSFMPSAIANCTMPHCRTDMYYRGVIVPPRSWGDWYALVAAFVAHLVERHGLAEVVQWRFEVWNEMWGTWVQDPDHG